jgi:hypothetical protein
MFPVASFGASEGFTGKWAPVYARAALKRLTQRDVISRYLSPEKLESMRGSEVAIDRVIPDEYAVLVLGREALNRFGVSDRDVPLLMLKEGVLVIEPGEGGSARDRSSEWTPVINVSKYSSIFSEDAHIFVKLFKAAERTGGESGTFIILYQVLEYCIEKVFEWGISGLVDNEISTRELKKRLSSITTEIYRLNILNTYCLSGGVDRKPMVSLAAEACKLLAALEVKLEEGRDWPALLYAVRNIVVHNQVRLMKIDLRSLDEINAVLKDVCLEIIFHFQRPDRSLLWSQSESERVEAAG